MRAKNIYQFQVRGRGLFPTDMLRYDDCWPASQEDQDMVNDETREARRAERTITLRTVERRGVPTYGRWESFMWRVL